MTSIASMSSSPAVPAASLTGTGRESRLRFLGRVWPVIWVVSSAYTAWVLLRNDRPVPAVLFVTSTVLAGVAAARGPVNIRMGRRSDDRLNLVLLAAAFLCAVPCVWLMQAAAMALVFYVAVASSLVLEMGPALAITLLLTLAGLAVDGRPGWGQTNWVAVGVLASGVGAGFGRRGAVRGRQAEQARAFAHQMEINDERNRMARDLHDILGHSLTVITLKSELAEKLVDVDPAAAKEQLAELRSLSRSALADVRATVNNYRELSLAGELARASNTLSSAQVSADLPLTVEVVRPELRELFAWALREAVTNVVRHAQARHCWAELAPDAITITDDGVGISGGSDGHGLEGLRQRCEDSGAELQLGPGPGGHGTRLRVRARDLSASPLLEGDLTRSGT